MTLREAKTILMKYGYKIVNRLNEANSLYHSKETDEFEDPFEYCNFKERPDDNATEDEAEAHDICFKILKKIETSHNKHTNMTRSARDENLRKMMEVKDIITRDSYYNEAIFNYIVDFLRSDDPPTVFDIKTVTGKARNRGNDKNKSLDRLFMDLKRQIAVLKSTGIGNVENIQNRINRILEHPDLTDNDRIDIEAKQREFDTIINNPKFGYSKRNPVKKQSNIIKTNNEWIINAPSAIKQTVITKCAQAKNVDIINLINTTDTTNSYKAIGKEKDINAFCNATKCSYTKLNNNKHTFRLKSKDDIDNVKFFINIIPSLIIENDFEFSVTDKDYEVTKEFLNTGNIEFDEI